MFDLAPIVLFVYKRPIHTKKVLKSLAGNNLAKKSTIYIYADGPKSNETAKDYLDIEQTRKVIKQKWGFKEIKIIESNTNIGLADSIINGVTYVIKNHKRVIVLEDDIEVSKTFLEYMNNSLDFYQNQEGIWHISAFNYPFDKYNKNKNYVWRAMNCWGWATWEDRWVYFNKEPNKIANNFTQNDIYRFNLDGYHPFWTQIIENINKEKNTWAIFWYATIFKNNGLCVNPEKSFVRNIGHDGSGIHCSKTNVYKIKTLNRFSNKFHFETTIKENKTNLKKVKLFYKELHNNQGLHKSNLFTRIKEKLIIIYARLQSKK